MTSDAKIDVLDFFFGFFIFIFFCGNCYRVRARVSQVRGNRFYMVIIFTYDFFATYV